MAHYARVNSENIVTFVTPIPNEMIVDENGVEHEERALNHLYSSIPDSIGDRWIQTSYNNNFRNKYACIGDYYDEIYDAFITPPLYESFVFNATTLSWEPPIPYPGDPEGIEMYRWDESILSWVEIPME